MSFSSTTCFDGKCDVVEGLEKSNLDETCGTCQLNAAVDCIHDLQEELEVAGPAKECRYLLTQEELLLYHKYIC